MKYELYESRSSMSAEYYLTFELCDLGPARLPCLAPSQGRGIICFETVGGKCG